MNAKRFAVYPGHVTSKNDGQEHFIGFSDLCRLYGVPHAECIDMSQPKNLQGFDAARLTALRPRYDGNYTLPKST